jgi:hypothetical protein
VHITNEMEIKSDGLGVAQEANRNNNNDNIIIKIK